VNYGVFVDSQFVGGVHTSGEHFNVMWLHWNHANKGIGPSVASAILRRQLTQYGKAIVNTPNVRMCKALLKIMTPERRSRARCRDGIQTLTFGPGDLLKSCIWSGHAR